MRKEIAAIPHVKSVQFESKAQAYAQQSKQNAAAYQLLGANPLPDTFHVYPRQPGERAGDSRCADSARRAAAMIDPSIQTVSNKKGYTKRALELTSAVKWGGLAFALLLTLASMLLIANTIRLSLYARRREMEVMKLVGATDWFIRWPFVIEGVIVGAAGGVLAIVVLGVTKVALLDPLFSSWSLVSQTRTIAFPALIAVLLGGERGGVASGPACRCAGSCGSDAGDSGVARGRFRAAAGTLVRADRLLRPATLVRMPSGRSSAYRVVGLSRGGTARARGRHLARRAPELAAVVAAQRVRAGLRRAPGQPGDRHHHPRLLPAREPRPAAQQRDGGDGRRASTTPTRTTTTRPRTGRS